MKSLRIFLLVLFVSVQLSAQTTTAPYYEIPKASNEASAGAVLSRMVDGLGFRFYWASEGLTEKDLAFQPSKEVRTTGQTVTHIYDLTKTLLSLTKTEFKQSKAKADMTFEEIRVQALLNLEALSKRFRASKDLQEFNVSQNGKVTVPFWNLINGPIADAIWHCGQLASFRRSTGNPINPNVNHFTSTVRQ
ncbi:hypothetical protein GCM10011416_18530 [Polaribacter pacificus]|uniref:DinB superfamily protein n=1 Tax=Polaribacter pacificus TaxID=1775173 RepID=A0A917I061_9FLAO|nr:hypothetical protein [Polaribacter pacificus]GGH00344.1 hypothetical protein GCM10011416_18530 [Polaribacter pacificus]